MVRTTTICLFTGLLLVSLLDGTGWCDETTRPDKSDPVNILLEEGWVPADYFPDGIYRQCCEAIAKGNTEVLEKLSADGLDVNFRGKDGMTLLMWSFASGQFESFDKLLALGADPNQSMEVELKSPKLQNMRPMRGDCMTIVIFGEASKPWRKSLLEHGGNINAVNSTLRVSVLMVAGRRNRERTEATREILEKGPVDLNFQDEFGMTAAMDALMGGDYERVTMIVEAGASVDCYDGIHQQLIDKVARRWVNMRRRWEEEPELKQVWLDDKVYRPAFEKLVFLLSERGFDLQTAMLGVMREKEMIDGVPYYEWRRRKRGHMDAGCPGLSNASDQK